MKYILIPVLKVLWSVILTIGVSIGLFPYFIYASLFVGLQWLFYAIWEFKFNRFNLEVFNSKYSIKYDDEDLMSVFHDKQAAYNRRYDIQQRETIYKSIYHYIWGIYKN